VNSTGIRAGDIVRCDVRGGRFWARVSAPMREIDKLGKRITLEPLDPASRQNLPSQWVTSRQVIGHWRERTGSQV
jgi:hypothetical protein